MKRKFYFHNLYVFCFMLFDNIKQKYRTTKTVSITSLQTMKVLNENFDSYFINDIDIYMLNSNNYFIRLSFL